MSWKRDSKRQAKVISQVDHHGKQLCSVFSWPSSECGFDLHFKNISPNSLGSRIRIGRKHSKNPIQHLQFLHDPKLQSCQLFGVE